MKKIDKKTQPNKLVIISIIISVALVITALVFIYMPFAEKTKSLRAEILKERDRNVLIGKIRALGKHLKVYEKRIPETDAGVSWLLGNVSDMASKEKIEISSLTPGAAEDYGLYKKVYVVVDMVASYAQFGRFISRVESSEKFLKVENLDIKRLDQEVVSGKGSGRFKPFDIKANVVISTLTMKE
jgi:Tfp pilus assembly protein PilO